MYEEKVLNLSRKLCSMSSNSHISIDCVSFPPPLTSLIPDSTGWIRLRWLQCWYAGTWTGPEEKRRHQCLHQFDCIIASVRCTSCSHHCTYVCVRWEQQSNYIVTGWFNYWCNTSSLKKETCESAGKKNSLKTVFSFLRECREMFCLDKNRNKTSVCHLLGCVYMWNATTFEEVHDDWCEMCSVVF